MLTDMYQISMTYAYWKAGRHNHPAVFDLFFRDCPFKGKYVVFGGLDECVRFIAAFKFTQSDVEYLKTVLPLADAAFFTWLLTLDCSQMEVHAMRQGEIVFPREPLIRISGPLALGQLVETTLLNLINFPSLIATNANRMRRVAPFPKYSLLEFGLRRAQGPDGGYSATKYALLGGFDGTSNVLAGKLNQWDGSIVKGTMAHAFIMTYSSLSDVMHDGHLINTSGEQVNFYARVIAIRIELGFSHTNEGELASFIAYAQAFPKSTLCLVDTYDTLHSGVPNFICVAFALAECGYAPRGVRLDSGDLGPLSVDVRKLFIDADKRMGRTVCTTLNIVASDDLDEARLAMLTNADNAYEINTFGIGTNLVTCKAQPALGCVYKLVKIAELPRIKLSENPAKVTLPNKKKLFRFFGPIGEPMCDVALVYEETDPVPGVSFSYYKLQAEAGKKHYEYTLISVVPSKVESLLVPVWIGGPVAGFPSLAESKAYCEQRVKEFYGSTSVYDDVEYLLGLSEALHNQTEQLKQDMRIEVVPAKTAPVKVQRVA